jgi:acetyltransferase-like isoleucine patch superfamily enzyme
MAPLCQRGRADHTDYTNNGRRGMSGETLTAKVGRIWQEELEGLHPRLQLARLALAPLPPFVGSRLRVQIGHGTVLWGLPTILGSGNIAARLHIGRECWINVGCLLDVNESLVIGDRVALGQEVMILTNGHRIAERGRRAGALDPRPVTIEPDAWLSTRCTILPGVTVGEGAVVAAGAVVTKSVPPHVIVGGVPAQVLRSLTADEVNGAADRRALLATVATPTISTATMR